MLLPVADQGSARVFSIWGDIEDKERYHHEEGPRDADVGSPQAVLARGSSPQAALRQPRMGAHILLVFGKLTEGWTDFALKSGKLT